MFEIILMSMQHKLSHHLDIIDYVVADCLKSK